MSVKIPCYSPKKVNEVWLVDGEICYEKEMLDIFYDNYVSEVTDEEEYQKGKQWLIKNFSYEEKDFEEHPTMLKIDVLYGRNDDCQYALENDFDPIGNDYLPDDFKQVDVEDLLYLYDLDLDDMEW